MDEKQIQRMVAEVLKRLLPHIGADGQRGTVIAAFTGATAGYDEAIEQVRTLVTRGYSVQLVFSQGAEGLYAKYLWEQLEGFPHVSLFAEAHWLKTLKDCCAVVVPILSLNTLSKLSLLLADNLASNVILHALFAGKPVVVARNGTDPTDKGRKVRHFDQCGPIMAAAIEERFRVIDGYGCRVTDISELSSVLQAQLDHSRPVQSAVANGNGFMKPVQANGNIVTAADVMKAFQHGAELRLRASTVITPLARELAVKHGVTLLRN